MDALSLIDDLGMAVVVLDRQFRISSTNALANLLAGGEHVLGRGRSGLELIHPEDRARVAEEFRRLVEDGGRTTVRFRFAHPVVYKHVIAMASNRLDEPVGGVVVALRSDALERFIARMACNPSGQTVIVHDRKGRVIVRSADAGLRLETAGSEHLAWPYPEPLRTMLTEAALPTVRRNGYWHGTTSEGAWMLAVLADLDDPDGDVVVAFVDDAAWEPRFDVDGLTGLPDRSAVLSRLGERLRRSGSAGTLGVVLVDVDRFKVVNDAMGHSVGDELLRVVAARLRPLVAPGDLIGRLGSDEFVLLLERATPEELTVDLAELEQDVLDAFRYPVEVRGVRLYLTVSIGLAINDDPDVDAEGLLRRCDLAAFDVKRRGGGRAGRFEPRLATEAAQSVRLRAELRDALDEDDFIAVYEPVISLGTGAVISFEALVRWQHRHLGVLGPSQFLDAAASTELIERIDTLVLNHAVRELAAWRRLPGQGQLTVSVNVSSRQLARADLADLVAATLEEHRLPASALMLEITEGALVQDLSSTVERLASLRSIGVRLAIDDFGVGHSSLDHLRHFDVDVVKIDQGFVSRALVDGRDREIIKAVTQLAPAFQSTTTAEGVETPKLRALVAALGCDAAQGHVISRPLMASEVPGFVTAQQASQRAARPSPDPTN